MIMFKVKKFKAYNMIVTNVGELLSFHPIFNPVVKVGISFVPWIVQHKLYYFQKC
jgi:hypothetical protein